MMRQQRWWTKVAMGLAFAVVAVAAVAAMPVDGASLRYPKGGGSGDVPTPLNVQNRVLELADGEPYVLVGRVVFWRETPYFEVDLSEQPWLANTKRKNSPYYALESSAYFWKQFENLRVKLTAEAHGVVAPTGSGQYTYEIHLYPLSEPSVLKP